MKARGFTLVEVVIALAILSLSLVALHSALGNSLSAAGRLVEVKKATLLAQQLMESKLVELQSDMVKGKFPDDSVEDEGNFEAPFSEFRWRYRISTIEFALQGEELSALVKAPEDGETSMAIKNQQVPETAMRSMAQLISKQLGESLRKVELEVLWGDEAKPYVLRLTTHIARLK